MEAVQTVIDRLSDGLSVDNTLIQPYIERYESSGDAIFEKLSERCHEYFYLDPDWLLLSGRLRMYGHKLTCPPTFSEAMRVLEPNLNESFYNFVMDNSEVLDSMIDHERDYKYDIKAFMVYIKSYAARLKGSNQDIICESPQYTFLRVAVFLWMTINKSEDTLVGSCKTNPFYNHLNLQESLITIKQTYDDMTKWNLYTHASPTVFNSGLKTHSLCSCFVMSVEDSMRGKMSIPRSWEYSALISCMCGGLGIDLSAIRSNGSPIGKSGVSKGVGPWIGHYDAMSRSCDQGGKRPAALSMWLHDFHGDLLSYLDLKRNDSVVEGRARNLFYGLMISDEFMRRVETDGDWTLFCPNKAKGLNEKYGLDFENSYRLYENDKDLYGGVTIRARELWEKILETQISTGTPYLVYKNAFNAKCNQNNLGTIKLSNLCTEISLYTDKDNIGSCNLASICLNSFIVTTKPIHDDYGVYSVFSAETGTRVMYYDFKALECTVRRVVHNLNRVIDRNYYDDGIPEIKDTNNRNRPLGIGVQGLADVFAVLDMCWEDPEARELNKLIFETMYYAGVTESCELARRHGQYPTFLGSPASKGMLQFDLWEKEKVYKDIVEETTGNGITKLSDLPELTEEMVERINSIRGSNPSGRYNWSAVRMNVVKYGMMNSLLFALMPTASTSSMFGNTPSIEPKVQQFYVQNMLGGQSIDVNKHMVRDFKEIGIWVTDVVRGIIEEYGSVQKVLEDASSLYDISIGSVQLTKDEFIDRVNHLRKKYKTAFEIPQRALIDMSADRGRFVCQSQSFNCFFKESSELPTKLHRFHMYGWKSGLKTGMYYLRQRKAVIPINQSVSLINIESPQLREVMDEDTSEDYQEEDDVSDTSGDINYKPLSVSKGAFVCTDEVCVACGS